MIGICRLFLALVAAALVACPVMALDVQNRGDGIEAMLVSKSVQAAPGIEDIRWKSRALNEMIAALSQSIRFHPRPPSLRCPMKRI